jgi:hypothetical protein
MKLSNKIKQLKLTEDIISYFFSKTKLSEHTIDEIELITAKQSARTRNNNISYLLRISLIYNKASNQPKRTSARTLQRSTTTLEININSIREYYYVVSQSEYKLKRLLNE